MKLIFDLTRNLISFRIFLKKIPFERVSHPHSRHNNRTLFKCLEILLEFPNLENHKLRRFPFDIVFFDRPIARKE